MTPQVLSTIVMISEALLRWFQQHNDGAGKDHGEFLRGVLSDYDEAKQVEFEIYIEAGRAGALQIADGRTVKDALADLRTHLNSVPAS